MKDTKKVTRVEVIDNSGRAYINSHPDNTVMVSFQDDGRTLKIFITKTKKDEF